LSSCGGAVDFSTWVVAYNLSVERAQNQILLMNVLRASDDMPLVMSSVQVVRGNGATSAAVGTTSNLSNTKYASQSAAFIDSLSGSAGPSALLTVTDGFNFDVAMLDTAEFEVGFLTPVRVTTLSLFLQRGVPIAVLLNLLVESATLNAAEGSAAIAYNDPRSPTYSAFQRRLNAAIKAGITIEPQPSSRPVGPVLTVAEAKGDLKSLVEGAKGGVPLKPTVGGFQFHVPNTEVRFCFMNDDLAAPEMPQETLCKMSPRRRPTEVAGLLAAATMGTADGTPSKDAISFNFRSTRDVFTYLGHLVQAELEYGPGVVPLVEQPRPPQLGGSRMVPLFNVVKDETPSGSLVDVSYRKHTYSVPKNNASYSAEVLNILDELVKLSKSINAVPPTGTVVLH